MKYIIILLALIGTGCISRDAARAIAVGLGRFNDSKPSYQQPIPQQQFCTSNIINNIVYTRCY